MTLTPMNAKQITHIHYNEQSEELTVHFHQGHIQAYSDVPEKQYQLLIESPNLYDSLVELTHHVDHDPSRRS